MATNIGPVIGIEGESEFRNQIRQINASLQMLKSEEDAVTSAYDKNDQSAEKLTRQNDVLNKRIEEQKSCFKSSKKGLQKASTETGENSTVTLKWQSAVNRATTDLNKMERQLTDNNEVLAQMQAEITGTDNALDSMSQESSGAASAVDLLANTLMAEKLLNGLKNIAEMLWDCVDASVEFESAMAGVAKTTDMSDEELSAMGEQLKTLSTQMPVAATELASIAESAGQLGIAKENLVSFSTVMANLGVSTNMSATDAATSLARFANITTMASENYERLGSTIVALGNNFATTESEIVEMGTRLASAGSVVGLTEAEIMAVATALSSVGVEAEAGGSATAKLLKQFETMVATGDKSLGNFAKVAGMTADEFSAAWGENALETLALFIEGLGNLDEQGGNATATMSELGLTEVRLSNAVLALAQSDGILTKALNLSNTAWGENTALLNEAETRYGTTESKFTMLENAVNNLKIAIGDALTPALGSAAEAGTGILNWVTEFIENNPWLVKAISALAVGLGVLAGAILAAKAAMLLFKAVMDSFTVVKVVAAITSLIAVLGTLASFSGSDEAEKAAKQNEDLAKSIEETTKAYEDSIDEIENEQAATETLLNQLVDLSKETNKTVAQKENDVSDCGGIERASSRPCAGL